MPLSKDDQLRIEEAEKEAAIEGSAKLLVRDPTEHQKLSPFTVICVVLNRMIGESFTDFDYLVVANDHRPTFQAPAYMSHQQLCFGRPGVLELHYFSGH